MEGTEQDQRFRTIKIGDRAFRASRFNLGLLRRNRAAVEAVSSVKAGTVPSAETLEAMVSITYAAIAEGHRILTKENAPGLEALPTREEFEDMLDRLAMTDSLTDVANAVGAIMTSSGFEQKKASASGEAPSAAS